MIVNKFNRRKSDDRRSIHKEPLNLLSRKYVIARFYVSVSILITILTAIFDRTTPLYQVLLLTSTSQVPICIALSISIISILDLCINDIAPDKYVIKYSYEYRHLIYMALSIVSFSMSAGILYTFGTSLSLSRLWLDGIISAMVAIFDIFARHKERQAWQCGPY